LNLKDRGLFLVIMNEIEKIPPESLKELQKPESETQARTVFPVCALIENIRSLYNVGSIFRTSDGAGIEHLYLGGYTGFPPRKEISKTSLGSVDYVPWTHDSDAITLAKDIKKRGYKLIALEHTKQSVGYDAFEYDFPLCFVLGNEVEGMSQELLDLCDSAIEIPMFGKKQSLNVSVAFGIIAYHIAKQYRNSI
jgi:tRNA G18 (ribose-2'-O)-methylase SpoU